MIVGVQGIRESLGAISKQVAAQVENGRQTKILHTDFAACGQYFDQSSEQRGVHGTAWALRVLSRDRQLAPRLIGYLTRRRQAEVDNPGLAIDETNVIKVAETLYALSFVDPSIARTEAERVALGEVLIRGKSGDGWGYFLNVLESWQPLPTAFAVMALRKSAGVDPSAYEAAAKLLLSTVQEIRPDDTDSVGTDISVRVFCLYVLAFGGFSEKVVKRSELEKQTGRLWQRLAPLLKEDVEQNIAYQNRIAHSNHYVRVPHQLYLLALVALYSPFQRFGSVAAQSRARSIVRGTVDQSFYYPHSGRLVSVRTNAIAFECLSHIDAALSNHRISWLGVGYVWDVLRSLVGSWVVRASAAGVGALFLSIALYNWNRGSGQLEDLGPDAFVSVLLFLVSLGKSRDR